MSIPFFQAQDAVGSRLAAIRRTDSGRVETRSWPILSHVRLFGFGKHRTLSLELELSRAFVNSVGKNARNRDGGTWNGHISVSRVHETRIGTLFSFWQWLRQCLVNLKIWAWTMNKVLSHSSEIVTLLSVLEEIYVAACLWLLLRVSSPFWNPEIGLNSSETCLGLRDFPHPATPKHVST